MTDLSKIYFPYPSSLESFSQDEPASPAYQVPELAYFNFEELPNNVNEEKCELKNNNSTALLSKEDDIKTISLKIWNELESEKKDDEALSYELETARFPKVPTEPTTMVIASDGTKLPFNLVSCVGDKKLAIVGQYPTPETLASYSRMLVDTKPAALVILSPSEEIASGELPDYFSADHTYEHPDQYYYVDFSVKKENSSSDICPENSDFDLYTNNITISNGEHVDISVIHFQGWSDYSILTVNKLDELVNFVTHIRDKNIDTYDQKEWLVIHCLAGVDRSGVLLAAIAIHDDVTRQSNLKAIINDIRASRNSWMVSYEAQLRCLVAYCVEKGYPLDELDHSDQSTPHLQA